MRIIWCWDLLHIAYFRKCHKAPSVNRTNESATKDRLRNSSISTSGNFISTSSSISRRSFVILSGHFILTPAAPPGSIFLALLPPTSYRRWAAAGLLSTMSIIHLVQFSRHLRLPFILCQTVISYLNFHFHEFQHFI